LVEICNGIISYRITRSRISHCFGLSSKIFNMLLERFTCTIKFLIIILGFKINSIFDWFRNALCCISSHLFRSCMRHTRLNWHWEIFLTSNASNKIPGCCYPW
jgi:hypothetical protein